MSRVRRRGVTCRAEESVQRFCAAQSEGTRECARVPAGPECLLPVRSALTEAGEEPGSR